MIQHRAKPYDVLLDNSHTHHLANLYPSLPTLNVYHDVYQKPVRCGVVLSIGQKAAMNMERQKVWVIPNVIQDVPLPNEDKRGDYVLFIGAIDPLKNPLLAIQAAANANVPLVMAGRVSPQFPMVQSPSLRYAGIVTGAQKWRLYYHARAMLQTGVNESFGLTTLESQLMGTPVIGVASGGTPELIRNDETGFLLSTEASIARWGEAIRDVIHLGHTVIRQHALGFTDVDKWVRQYEAALVSVASGDWWGES
jgi:glycosyltransferase involved in cell wall biosynthesis